jgi:uncharacterized membrane protein YgdD (TMEM256/DUF423 family)
VHRQLFAFGCGMGFLAVAGGAFGAHALKQALTADALVTWEIGARYLAYHAVPVLLVALHADRLPRARLSGWAFVLGAFIFTGSLWSLSLTGARWLGAVTPIGGVMFLGGWATLAWAGLTHTGLSSTSAPKTGGDAATPLR